MTNWAFDDPEYRRLTNARLDVVHNVIRDLRKEIPLNTALDAGCGIGAFSLLLSAMGLDVFGVDGRQENVAEARRRFPRIAFQTVNIESESAATLSPCDFVLCAGLLYHLENPLQAVRNLHALTGKVLLVESMCVPDRDAVLYLRDEGLTGDQGLAYVALYPSASCLERFCYAAGFPYVYRLRDLPEHEHFRPPKGSDRIRTMFLASKVEINLPAFTPAPKVSYPDVPGKPKSNGAGAGRSRLMRFLHKSPEEKLQTLRWRWTRAVPSRPWAFRLPWGSRWLPREDGFHYSTLVGAIKPSEYRFVQRYLREGMTVLDVGAHRGLFTLLAAQCVGPKGTVLAFEPSPRERAFLQENLRINQCPQVSVHAEALGAEEGQGALYQVQSHESGCNSLRPPAVEAAVQPIAVPVTTVDRLLAQAGIQQVDLLKIDVEGGELDVLRGAQELLRRRPRPIVFVEVSELRTAAWGYAPAQILTLLRDLGFHWFEPYGPGDLCPADLRRGFWDDNFVAVPEERLGDLVLLGPSLQGAATER